MRFSRNLLVHLIGLFAVGVISIHAQATDPVPLKNWPAPVSWQATTPHELAAAHESSSESIKPQLSTSGGTTQLGVLVAITPCRLVDTRSDMPVPFGSGTSSPLTWSAGSQTTILATALAGGPYYYGSGTSNPVTNSCNALPAALAYSASITVIPQPTLSWLSVCPTGTSTANCQAIAALTDYQGAAVLSNAAVIPATAMGSFDVFVKNATQVIIDVNGYYTSPSAVALGLGTAAAPSLTFTGDSTTGLYSSGPGTVNIATSGANRLTVTSNGDIGIGTTTPAFPLDVLGTVNANNPATSGFANGVQGNTMSNSGAGIQGNAQQAGAFGVHGNNNATSGYAVGVQGNTSSTSGAGVQGGTNQAGAYGVVGNNNATSGYAVGVTGNTNSTGGAGVQGNAHNGGAFGVSGFNSATSGWAVGTQGASSSPGGIGLLGVGWDCSSGTGCNLVPGTALQLQTATTGTLIQGLSGAAASNSNTAVSVFSVNGQGAGYFGGGVTGVLNAAGGAAAVAGLNTASSGFAVGVGGVSSSSGGAGIGGISGTCNNSCAVMTGSAGSLYTSSATGGYLLQGFSGPTGSDFLTGTTQAFYVDGQGNGYFKGSLTVGGNISKGGGSFRIDHPLDPENKYLYHSFVESPDMKNIYDGVVSLDEEGEATVQMPDWFEALNQDFRYQLTCIGGYAPVYIASKVSGNEFRIAGGRAGLEVSWQVTGIRHDAYANTHRIPVEQAKPANARSIYPGPTVSGGATSGAAQHP